jgi:hypothetical protein
VPKSNHVVEDRSNVISHIERLSQRCAFMCGPLPGASARGRRDGRRGTAVPRPCVHVPGPAARLRRTPPALHLCPPRRAKTKAHSSGAPPMPTPRRRRCSPRVVPAARRRPHHAAQLVRISFLNSHGPWFLRQSAVPCRAGAEHTEARSAVSRRMELLPSAPRPRNIAPGGRVSGNKNSSTLLVSLHTPLLVSAKLTSA